MSQPTISLLQNVAAHNGIANCIAIGHITGTYYATGGEDKMMNIWRLGDDTPIKDGGPFAASVTAIDFSPDDQQVICGIESGRIFYFDFAQSNTKTTTWKLGKAPITCITFNPSNQKQIFATDIVGNLYFINVNSSSVPAPIQTNQGRINCFVVSPNGRYIATGGDDTVVTLVDILSQQIITQFEEQSGIITSLAFNQSSSILASGSSDFSIKLYNLALRSEMPSNISDSSPISALVFYNDTLLISLSAVNCLILSSEGDLINKYPINISDIKTVQILSSSILIASLVRDHAIISRIKNIPELSKTGQVKSNQNSGRNSKQTSAKGVPKEEKIRTIKLDNNDSCKGECTIYREFREDHFQFVQEMNSRAALTTRLSDILKQNGLSKTLENAVLSNSGSSDDFSEELLKLIITSPKSVKLSHASYILTLANKIIAKNPTLAVKVTGTTLDSFAATVRGTLAMASQQIGVDMAKEERIEKAQAFITAFKDLAPSLREIQSGHGPNSKKAGSILSDYNVFLKQ